MQLKATPRLATVVAVFVAVFVAAISPFSYIADSRSMEAPISSAIEILRIFGTGGGRPELDEANYLWKTQDISVIDRLPAGFGWNRCHVTVLDDIPAQARWPGKLQNTRKDT